MDPELVRESDWDLARVNEVNAGVDAIVCPAHRIPLQLNAAGDRWECRHGDVVIRGGAEELADRMHERGVCPHTFFSGVQQPDHLLFPAPPPRGSFALQVVCAVFVVAINWSGLVEGRWWSFLIVAAALAVVAGGMSNYSRRVRDFRSLYPQLRRIRDPRSVSQTDLVVPAGSIMLLPVQDVRPRRGWWVARDLADVLQRPAGRTSA